MNPMVEMIFCKNNNHHPKKKHKPTKIHNTHIKETTLQHLHVFTVKKKTPFFRVSPFKQDVFFGQKKSRLSPSSWASPNQTARYHSCYKDRFRWPIVGNQTSKSCHDVEDHPRKWRNTADGRNPAPPGMYKTL